MSACFVFASVPSQSSSADLIGNLLPTFRFVPRRPVPRAVKSLKELAPEALATMTVHAVRAISGGSKLGGDFPERLPPNMAARHRQCTAIANAVRELGYMGDMGYNQLLYPNERDTRRLASWIVSKLPRPEEEAGAGAGSGGASGGLGRALFRGMKSFVTGVAAPAASSVATAAPSAAVAAEAPSAAPSSSAVLALRASVDAPVAATAAAGSHGGAGAAVVTSPIAGSAASLQAAGGASAAAAAALRRQAGPVRAAALAADPTSAGVGAGAGAGGDDVSAAGAAAGGSAGAGARATLTLLAPSALASWPALVQAARSSDVTSSGAGEGVPAAAVPLAPLADAAASWHGGSAGGAAAFFTLGSGAAGASLGVLAPLEVLAAGLRGNAAAAGSSGSGFGRAVASAPGLPARTPRAALFPGTFADAWPSAFTRACAFAVPAPAGGGLALGMRGPRGAGAAAGDGAKTEEEIVAEREAELAALAAALDALLAEVAALQRQHRLVLSTLPGLQAAIVEAEEQSAVLERRFLVRRACLDMLPDAPKHLAALAAEIEESGARLLALAEEWERHRGPLVASIHDALEGSAQRTAAAEALRVSMGEMRREMASLQASAAAKEDEIVRLTEEYAALQASIGADATAAAAAEGGAGAGAGADGASAAPSATRSLYTRRIMEIIKQIRKQKAEIGRIVRDVRGLQVEIAGSSDKLQRTLAIAGETMEKAASEAPKDAAYRTVLRQLLTVQELFTQLVSATSSLGSLENELRALDARVEQLASRDDAASIAAVMRDVGEVRAENASLEAQLRALGVGAA